MLDDTNRSSSIKDVRFISKRFRTSSSVDAREPRPPFSEPMTVIGHRGFGKGEREGNRENTVPSILSAYNAGAPWVEIDARRTATDDLIAYHYRALDEIGMVTGLPISTATNHGLATVEDLLTAVPDNRGLNIEIKPSLIDAGKPRHETTTALLSKLIRSHPRPIKLLVSSFDPTVITQVRKEMPNVSTGFLAYVNFPIETAINTGVRLGSDVVCMHVSSLGLRKKSVDASFVYKAIHQSQSMGLQVMVWGVKPKDVASLQTWNVDAICVDDVPGAIDELTTLS